MKKSVKSMVLSNVFFNFIFQSITCIVMFSCKKALRKKGLVAA